MITIKGKSYNIHHQIVCRVMLENSDYDKTTSDFLLTSDHSRISDDYCGYILQSNNNPLLNNAQIFQCETSDISFDEGEILYIDPSGHTTRLYNPSSYTNSIFLTEKCNSNCLTCPQPPKKTDDNDWVAIFLKAIELMSSKTEFIGITGGEPTVKWQNLIDILSKCNTHIHDTHVQVLTNARILKDYNKAKELSDSNPNIFFGVPLYSDIDTTHDRLSGVQGSFWQAIEGLYNIERAGSYIELRIVITKQNYERLPQFAEFVYKTLPFVSSVAFMGLEPIGSALSNIDMLWVDPIDYSHKLEKALKILWKRGIPSMIFNHQLCTLPKRIWPLAKKSISDWKVRYAVECEACIEKDNCGGFFFSSLNKKSRGIKPIN